MSSLRPVRGTRDFLTEDSRQARYIEGVAMEMAQRYGFAEVSTPVFEFTQVFARTLGDTSDIVTKEMYTFEDRNGESLTLRPENTAGIVRAFISNKLTHALPLKVSYRGPMFRYERPQKGRMRQFHQIGVECLGIADPLADVDVIALGYDTLAALGLENTITLQINTLGDPASRITYREVLVGYLRSRLDGLSEESRVRLDQNPLRILDSKHPADQDIIAGAPSIADHLNETSRAFFDTVLSGLSQLGIPYSINEKLVRGLDYYCHTTFEFVTEALGAQGTVLAGGRYDALVEQMGGPSTPGTGWAAGIERLMMLCTNTPPPKRPIAVIPHGDDEISVALALSQRLRRAGLSVEFNSFERFAKRMRWANRINARACLILGSDECARGVVALRDMDSGEQHEVELDDLEDRLAQIT